MVSFAVAQYQEMSSILDCPRKSFVLFFVFLKKILVEGKKKELLNFKVKNLDLEEKNVKVGNNGDFVCRTPQPGD